MTGPIAPTQGFYCNKNEDDTDDNGSDEEKLFDCELDRRKFSEGSQDYRNKILDYQSNNPQDNFANKYMIAMTRTLRRSMKCLPATIQN